MDISKVRDCRIMAKSNADFYKKQIQAVKKKLNNNPRYPEPLRERLEYYQKKLANKEGQTTLK